MASLVNRNMTVVDKSDAVNVGTTSPKQDSDFEHNKNRYLRFYVLVLGILFFFGCHNYLQELIMTLPGFKVGVFLGYLEVLGVAVCSHAERHIQNDFLRRAPWSTYLTLCLCLLISSATSNIALGYINYPTKVVFRSCKLIPTMLIAITVNKKTIHWYELLFGSFISAGMVLFAAADFQVLPNFNFLGIALVSISVLADAFLPNFQEKIFECGCSRVEVTYYTNILCLAGMSIAFSITGDLQEAFLYAWNHSTALYLMTTYTFLAYIAISFHMALVKEFGGITTVLVGNTRKAMTIVLSFLLFPKPVSQLYFWGGLLVFGSLIANAYMKEYYRSPSSATGDSTGGGNGGAAAKSGKKDAPILIF